MIDELPTEVADACAGLSYQGIFNVNIGVGRPAASDKHWVYFYEDEFPFHRLSYPGNFSPRNVPDGKSSISTEVAYSRHRPLDRETMLERTIVSLQTAGILDRDEIELVHAEEILPAYVIYDLAHGRNVATIREWLAEQRIWTARSLRRVAVLQHGSLDEERPDCGRGDHLGRLGLSFEEALVTRRELLLLVPLLALYLAAWRSSPIVRTTRRHTSRSPSGWSTGGTSRGTTTHCWMHAPTAPTSGSDRAFRASSHPRPRRRARMGDAPDGAAAPLRRRPDVLRAGERDLGLAVGLLSAYALGLYLPFLGLVSNLHSEVLAVFLVCAAMLGLARYVRAGGFRWLALASGALAGLSLTRVAYGWVLTLVLVLFVLAWLVRRRRADGRVAAVLGIALILCLPWLAYTYAKTDRPLVWGNSGSLSLYWMASPYEGDHGDWHQAHLVFTDSALQPHRAFFASLRGRSLAEQNTEIEREALRNIADHPEAYIGNVLANVSRMLVNAPYSRVGWQTNDLFYAVPNLLLLAAAVVAGVVLVRRRRTLPPETAPFAVLAAVPFGLHALVASYPRMLAPIVPLVVWLVTLAFVESGVLTRVRRDGSLPSESA